MVAGTLGKEWPRAGWCSTQETETVHRAAIGKVTLCGLMKMEVNLFFLSQLIYLI